MTGKTLAMVWGGCALVCVLVGGVGLLAGSTGLGWAGGGAMELRLTSVLLAMIVGGALGASGCAYQAVFRNPLADPYLLGIASGAGLASYLYFTPAWLPGWMVGVSDAAGPNVFALGGALLIAFVAVGVSMRRGRIDPLTLVLTGVILSTLCGAVFVLLNQLHPEMTAGSGGPMRFWVGSIHAGVTPVELWGAGGVVLACVIGLCAMAHGMNVAQLSDGEATSVGQRVGAFRFACVVVASVAVAAAVSLAGPIAFVGLISPHVARLLLGAIGGGDYRLIVPGSAAAGAVLLILADATCRALSASHLLNTALPVGVLTSLLGGPFFLMLLWRAKRHDAL